MLTAVIFLYLSRTVHLQPGGIQIPQGSSWISDNTEWRIACTVNASATSWSVGITLYGTGGWQACYQYSGAPSNCSLNTVNYKIYPPTTKLKLFNIAAPVFDRNGESVYYLTVLFNSTYTKMSNLAGYELEAPDVAVIVDEVTLVQVIYTGVLDCSPTLECLYD